MPDHATREQTDDRTPSAIIEATETRTPALAHDDTSREETLGALLHAHAQHRERGTFAAQMIDGTLMASLALFSHAKPWMLVAMAGVGIAMHGLWSFADVRLDELQRPLGPAEPTRWSRIGWHLARGIAAIGGVLAVFALLLTLFGRTLGTWIS